MAETSSSFKKRYQNWKNRTSSQADSSAIRIKKVKESLFDFPASLYDEERYFDLLFFVQHRITLGNTSLIKDLAHTQNIDELDLAIHFANCVYLKLYKDYEKLKHRLHELPEPDNLKYLYKVLRHLLLKCNQEWLQQHYRKEESCIVDESFALEGGLITQSPFSELDLQQVALMDEAKNMSLYLLKEWNDRLRNVFCHYMDVFSNKKSSRLTLESVSNLHQLHKRLRDRLKGLVFDGLCTKEVFQLMIEHFWQEMCQQTPVLDTYKKQVPPKKEERND